MPSARPLGSLRVSQVPDTVADVYVSITAFNPSQGGALEDYDPDSGNPGIWTVPFTPGADHDHQRPGTGQRLACRAVERIGISVHVAWIDVAVQIERRGDARTAHDLR